MDEKQLAAVAAIDEIRDGTIVGLGSGSTAELFITALAEALREKRLRDVRGIATSVRSERLAQQLGIPVLPLSPANPIDVTVDGADEIGPDLTLIKGLGGALLREKIVAQNSSRLVIIADSSKTVATLGTRGALPVEVTPFGHEMQVAFFRSLGCVPKLRVDSAGAPFVTDNGNHIYDCRFARIDDAKSLNAQLRARAGVLENGLFIGMASVALVGRGNEVERRVAGRV